MLEIRPANTLTVPSFASRTVNLDVDLGALAIRYVFSTTITDSDPGNGKLRLSATQQDTALTIRADTVDVNGADVSGLLDAFDDSTNPTKGYIRIYAVGDPTKWLAFEVSAVAAPVGYRNITVANVAGSATSPFADGDTVLLSFQPAGDKGADATAEVPNGSITAPKLASSIYATEAEATEGSDNLKLATVLRVLQTVRAGGFIPRTLFGLRDTLADQTAALQAALDGIATETTLRGTGRGAVLNIEGWTGRIDNDITLPRHVRMGGMRPVPAVYYGELIDEWQPAIELASTATIRQSTGSGLHNMMIRRQGLITSGADGVTEVAKFAGTAISLPNNTGDQRNEGVAILGFDRAADTLDPVGAETALISRPYFRDIHLDCINGIRLKNAYDIPKLFSVHSNPWVTEQMTGPEADRSFRNGTFITMGGTVNDWAHLWDCFSYAIHIGFVIDGADDVRMFACGADHLPDRVNDGSRGLVVQGNVFDFICQGFVSAAKQDAIYLNSTDATARYKISGFATHAFDQNGIVLERGHLALSQSNIRGPGGGSGIGVQVAATAGSLRVDKTCTFEELGVGVLGNSAVPQFVDDEAHFINVGTRHSGRYIATVASASTIVAPPDQEFLQVTGAVGIGTMTSANVREGRTVTIQVADGLTIFNTATATVDTFNIGADTPLTSGQTLRVMRDLNGQWRKAV